MAVVVVIAATAGGSSHLARAGQGQLANQGRWEIIDLGEGCSPTALNERGLVVGSCVRGSRSFGFLWSGGKLIELGSLGPRLTTVPAAINERGEIAGAAVRIGPIGNTEGTVESQAFLWQNGHIERLDSAGLTTTQAVGINLRGQIIGNGHTKDGLSRALLWQNRHAVMLAGSAASMPAAINDRGQVILFSGDARIFLWQSGQLRNLGDLGGRVPYPTNAVSDINSQTEIVGSSRSTKGSPHPLIHAFVWKKGKMIDLGLPSGDVMTEATAINERGLIVGASISPAGDRRLFIWIRGKMTQLRGFGAVNVSLPGREALNDRGQVLVNTITRTMPRMERAVVWKDGTVIRLPTLGGSTRAVAINDRGQIIGTSATRSGHEHGAIWMLHSAS